MEGRAGGREEGAGYLQGSPREGGVGVEGLEGSTDIEGLREHLMQQFRETHELLPTLRELPGLHPDELHSLQAKVLSFLELVRNALKQKARCRMCESQPCEVICYPCKHQVLCRKCAEAVTQCPVPECGAVIQDIILPFSM